MKINVPFQNSKPAMTSRKLLFILAVIHCFSSDLFSQSENRVYKLFPQGTILHGNIPFNNDTLKKHLLDIYLPRDVKGNVPFVVFIHGGGWLVNDKYADIGYMGNTISALINNGIAVASVDYRFASQAQFPAQIQDCNQALSFLCKNAEKYHLDKNRIAIMGFSAGGHLASLQGLANNNKVPAFFMHNAVQQFNIKAVVDYYGPSELASLGSSEDPKAPEAILLGASPVSRPDLAKAASPVTYVDKNDPPFLIIHGEKDDMVSPRQSKLLSGWLTATGVKNELIIVKDAPHFGKMFDTEDLKTKVITFLNAALK
ncbi:alpha/beta hydrolase [Emticicia sp. CRIBPO]|uniref:alpha/beta hydrolase n=1 Tax=Emticicia sp. CRIBPO TaxID=2683258 RepID=UPI001E4B0F3C|nr:alpha/beta hydrolase [Emticicia sp. CRIBPO]